MSRIIETGIKKDGKTQLGEVDIKVPRDRNGEYEPQIIANTAEMLTAWKKSASRSILAA